MTTNMAGFIFYLPNLIANPETIYFKVFIHFYIFYFNYFSALFSRLIGLLNPEKSSGTKCLNLFLS